MNDSDLIRQQIITALVFAITLAFTSCDTVPNLSEDQSLTEGLQETTVSSFVHH